MWITVKCSRRREDLQRGAEGSWHEETQDLLEVHHLCSAAARHNKTSMRPGWLASESHQMELKDIYGGVEVLITVILQNI